ncbi:hypothetical protein ACEPAI_6549 [Sanghuangporus weigelae]
MMANSESHVRLAVLVHGLWGNPAHLMQLNRHTLQRWQTDSNVELLLVSSISDDLTHDGIDWGSWGSERAVTKFSTIKYSLGGLVCRYLVGIMHQKGYLQDGSLSTAHCMKPLDFVTIATPHLGIPRYPGLLHSFFSAIGDSLLSRTGRQLCLSDSWSEGDTARRTSTKRILLETMADTESPTCIALSMFESVAVYANAISHRNTESIHLLILKSWSAKRKRSVLPPYLRFDSPYNVLIYPLLPLLAPVFIGAAVIRLEISARKSWVRIHALEKDVSFTEAL